MNDIRKMIFNGLVWKLSERAGAVVVSFVVSIILARLMQPEEFGLIALVTVFISIASVFVTAGFGNALIQKKDVEDIDFSTIFFFNIIFSIMFYILLYIFAPYIALYYKLPILVQIIRVLGLRVIISSINNVQQAFVSRNMLFKKFFYSTLFGTVGGAIVGIGLAYLGYGVWALVAQNLTNAFIDIVVLWFTVKWRPKLMFSFNRLKVLFSYGWKLFISAMLDTSYNEIRALIIGKRYSSADLAYYNRGNSFPSLFITNINSSISGVLFPAVSKEQDDLKRVSDMTRKSIQISSYIISPIMFGLLIIAKPLVILLLTEKWISCVIYMQLGCIAYSFRPIITANLEAIKAIGRSDIFLKLEICKKIIAFLLIFLTYKYGVLLIAIMTIVIDLVGMVINIIPNQKTLNYNFKQQIADFLPSYLISIFMCILIYPIKYINLSPLMTICIQIFSGSIIYFTISVLTKNKNLYYIFNLIVNRRKYNV